MMQSLYTVTIQFIQKWGFFSPLDDTNVNVQQLHHELLAVKPQSIVKENCDISATIWYTLKHTPQMLDVLQYSGTNPYKKKKV